MANQIDLYEIYSNQKNESDYSFKNKNEFDMLCGKKPLSYAIKEPFNKFIVPFLTEIYYRPTFNKK